MYDRKHERIINFHNLFDIVLTVFSFLTAYFMKKYLFPETLRGLTTAPNYYILLLMIIIIWYLALNMFGLYSSYRRCSFSEIFWNMVKAVCTGMVGLVFCMYLSRITDVSRIMICTFFLLNLAFLSLSKLVIYRISGRALQRGLNSREILIIGSKDKAKSVIDTVAEYSSSEYRVLGCLELHPNDVGKEVKNGIKVIGTLDQLRKFLLERVVDEIIIAMPLNMIKDVDKYMAIAEEIGVALRILPDWQIHRLMYQPGIARIHLENFLEMPTLALTTTPPKQGKLLVKNLLDYGCAVIALALSLPLFIFIAIAIKLSSEGPVLFKQERCGLNGRRFILYNFWTMVADAEKRRQKLEELDQTDGPVFKINKDPRITPYVGMLLRKTGLDELPQLINVLKGEMSLIGPRPPLPFEVDRYEFWQRRRLSMKPGLTCIWQIAPRRNEVSFLEWMKMDLSYIDNWSLALDFKILFQTARAVFVGSGR